MHLGGVFVVSQIATWYNSDAVTQKLIVMSNIARIIKSEENGVEFYTVAATGESGMSQSGLARFCGVGETTMRSLINSVRRKSPSSCLKPFQGKDVALAVAGADLQNAKIVKAEFCAAVIEHYAFEAKAKNETAMFAFRKFAAMGIDVFIQQQTGWKPPATTSKQLSQFTQKKVKQYEKQGKSKEWIGEKVKGVQEHNSSIQALIDHGCTSKFQHMHINSAATKELLGYKPRELRKERGLAKLANTTESMSHVELNARSLAHAIARERLDAKQADGYEECKDAFVVSATIVKESLKMHHQSLVASSYAKTSPSILTNR
jgi:hypothetical protein